MCKEVAHTSNLGRWELLSLFTNSYLLNSSTNFPLLPSFPTFKLISRSFPDGLISYVCLVRAVDAGEEGMKSRPVQQVHVPRKTPALKYITSPTKLTLGKLSRQRMDSLPSGARHPSGLKRSSPFLHETNVVGPLF